MLLDHMAYHLLKPGIIIMVNQITALCLPIHAKARNTTPCSDPRYTVDHISVLDRLSQYHIGFQRQICRKSAKFQLCRCHFQISLNAGIQRKNNQLIPLLLPDAMHRMNKIQIVFLERSGHKDPDQFFLLFHIVPSLYTNSPYTLFNNRYNQLDYTIFIC